MMIDRQTEKIVHATVGIEQSARFDTGQGRLSGQQSRKLVNRQGGFVLPLFDIETGAETKLQATGSRFDICRLQIMQRISFKSAALDFFRAYKHLGRFGKKEGDEFDIAEKFGEQGSDGKENQGKKSGENQSRQIVPDKFHQARCPPLS